ncbi:hypothetical protein PV05_01730 [Exophiala xenobiotica]|uniref:tRNA/rRNA methyltransferase SpoU type domain-containing protein n=1 Tax=Exophiala xenobiotica TaxID=348802 RepID=A0A0D2C9J6_9EURO|nr:uncharacterized protein PV05_01730 [Exophiala xenobiotica]KIW61631.1 hypothetical protein PV05_01730 [Exophiala xenobiotica]
MQSVVRIALRNKLACAASAETTTRRWISLTGAIEKGKRDGQYSRVKHERRYEDQRASPGTGNYKNIESHDGLEFDGFKSYRQRLKNNGRGRDSVDVGIPTSLPYTTATSEFIWGTHSVLAALKAKRRKIYRLYRLLPDIENPDNEQEEEEALKSFSSPTQDRMRRKKEAGVSQTLAEIYTIAEQEGLRVERVRGRDWKNKFSKATGGRPHNGILMETSPLSPLPVTALPPVKRPDDDISATIGWAKQEQAHSPQKVFAFENYVASNRLHPHRPAHRYPFMLLLDRITDTGNFGAIVRSAWFLGVDAILIPEHGTASAAGSTNALKASAGALEHMPILHVRSEGEFIKSSRENGWKFFAADASEAAGDWNSHNTRKFNKVGPLKPEGALLKYPCVLVLGNEETGVRSFMHNLVDGVVGIPNARPDVGDIDSLNVSVAAALLIQKFFNSARIEDAAV